MHPAHECNARISVEGRPPRAQTSSQRRPAPPQRKACERRMQWTGPDGRSVMAKHARTILGILAVTAALTGPATGALEQPAADRPALPAALLDPADVSAGGSALALAIASQ